MHTTDLPAGLTHLQTPSPRPGPLYSLVVDQLPEGPTYWIDARNAAVTHALYDCAASPRALESLQIARAFTAYRHHELIGDLSAHDPALVVAPNVAALDRDDRSARVEQTALLETTLERLGALECPVLATTTAAEAAAVAPHADTTLECVRTREGIRIEGEGAPTAGYWHGPYWQTTIPSGLTSAA
ncbi:MAG: hypothetical protein U5K37_01095 [Natrialbaceae archaeon]|nr:hypothetical protein [Natrialbaceae archaeon]